MEAKKHAKAHTKSMRRRTQKEPPRASSYPDCSGQNLYMYILYIYNIYMHAWCVHASKLTYMHTILYYFLFNLSDQLANAPIDVAQLGGHVVRPRADGCEDTLLLTNHRGFHRRHHCIIRTQRRRRWWRRRRRWCRRLKA